MDIKQRFQAYASDFELAYADNDWTRVGAHFAEDASYDAGDGSPAAVGREAIEQKFRNSVTDLDRRMDQRDLQLTAIDRDDDTVTCEWTVRYIKDDLPPLEVSGKEVARFSDGVMSELHSVIREESLAAYAEWMQAHGDRM